MSYHDRDSRDRDWDRGDRSSRGSSGRDRYSSYGSSGNGGDNYRGGGGGGDEGDNGGGGGGGGYRESRGRDRGGGEYDVNTSSSSSYQQGGGSSRGQFQSQRRSYDDRDYEGGGGDMSRSRGRSRSRDYRSSSVGESGGGSSNGRDEGYGRSSGSGEYSRGRDDSYGGGGGGGDSYSRRSSGGYGESGGGAESASRGRDEYYSQRERSGGSGMGASAPSQSNSSRGDYWGGERGRSGYSERSSSGRGEDRGGSGSGGDGFSSGGNRGSTGGREHYDAPSSRGVPGQPHEEGDRYGGGDGRYGGADAGRSRAAADRYGGDSAAGDRDRDRDRYAGGGDAPYGARDERADAVPSSSAATPDRYGSRSSGGTSAYNREEGSSWGGAGGGSDRYGGNGGGGGGGDRYGGGGRGGGGRDYGGSYDRGGGGSDDRYGGSGGRGGSGGSSDRYGPAGGRGSLPGSGGGYNAPHERTDAGDRYGGRGGGYRAPQERYAPGGRGEGRGGGSGYNRGDGDYGGRGGGGGRGGYGGGGYGGGGGGGRFGGRGRGRGGGGSSNVAVNPTESLSNLILADITTNFKFYLYGIDCSDRENKQVDSRRRRQELFMRGLFDAKDGLLPRLGLKQKELEGFRRVVFFEGSYFFCSRKVPGLEIEKLPLYLIAPRQATDYNGDAPTSENGDSLRVTTLSIHTGPTELEDSQDNKPPIKKEDSHTSTSSGGDRSSPGGTTDIHIDNRCDDCTKAFSDLSGLMSHCRNTGHNPVYNNDDQNEELTPSKREVFLSYCNVALQRAMGERMARWGREYIDPRSFTEPRDKDNNYLFVKVFKAYTCEFGLIRPDVEKKKISLALTVDLRAKVLRTRSLLDQLCNRRDPNTVRFTYSEMEQAKSKWCNEVVICTYDKRCYSVIDLLFEESPASMPVGGQSMSHAEYFATRKNITLDFPNASPLVAVLGRNNSTIYMPAELVCGNELEDNLKKQLPLIASFKPDERHKAIEEMKRYLTPGAQKSRGSGGGLLPALGIVLGDERIKVPVDCLSLPSIITAGVRIPDSRGEMWAPCLQQANFRVDAGEAIQLNVVVIYHRNLSRTFQEVYTRLASLVNRFNSHYRFGDRPYATVEAGDLQHHWEAVEGYFGRETIPDNVFVMDFTKPPRRSTTDPAYPVVKQMLGRAGYLSQFINFNTYDHGSQRSMKRSNIILQGVARQVLSKCGVRVWWVNVPRSLPLPCVFVGVDCFHAPRKYNPNANKRTAKESCAAVVVQLIRSADQSDHPTVEIYSETEKRSAGVELELGAMMNKAVRNALGYFKVDPMSCVVWRDGVGDPAIDRVAAEEIPQLRSALAGMSLEENMARTKSEGGDTTSSGGAIMSSSDAQQVSLAYIICQKRIATKFLTADGRKGMPAGALIEGLGSVDHDTFYINGTSPPYSTPKAVRFIIANRDEALEATPMSELSWALCHDYPNWTGPIKLPSPVQMAHKLAELAGGFEDCGDSINSDAFVNRLHFL